MVATGLGLSGAAPVETPSNVAVLPVTAPTVESERVEPASPPGPEMGAIEEARQRNYFDIPAYLRRRATDNPRV